jgi:hypothetical protein
MGERTEIYEREKLYEEVWKEPVLVVANRYGVSNVALAKACRKLAVPLPPRGYWARARAGRKAPPRPALPPYESPSRIQATRPVPGRSAGAAVSKVTDEKLEHGSAISTLKVPETSDSPSRTERKTEDDKRNPRKTSPKEFPEYLYCTIDGWQRTFRFGINPFRSTKSLDKEDAYDEWDHLQVFATVRHHEKPRKGRKRTGQRIELWLHPTHVPRTDWRDDPEAVGGVWTEQGKLFGTLSIPADSFYSLFPCLASNHFKELELRLLRMHYRQGDIHGIAFRPKETPMEDLLH